MSRFSTMLYSSKYIYIPRLSGKKEKPTFHYHLCEMLYISFYTLNSIIVIAIMTVIITIIVIVSTPYMHIYRSSCATMWEACLGFAIAECLALWFLSIILPRFMFNFFVSFFMRGVLWAVIKIIHWQTLDTEAQRWETIWSFCTLSMLWW